MTICKKRKTKNVPQLKAQSFLTVSSTKVTEVSCNFALRHLQISTEMLSEFLAVPAVGACSPRTGMVPTQSDVKGELGSREGTQRYCAK